MKPGTLVRWHFHYNGRRDLGYVIEEIGTRWANNHRIVVQWANGEKSKCRFEELIRVQNTK